MAQLNALAGWTRVVEESWSRDTLEKAFRDHHDKVFAAALRITGNAMDAEDALQTVFLKLARARPAGTPSDQAALGRYLQRAGVNAALDTMRAAARHPATQIDAGPEVAEAATDAHSPWMRARLRRALAALAPRAAEVFALRYLEGFSNREIGALLGTSESVVGVTLFRARAQIRDALAAGLEEHE